MPKRVRYLGINLMKEVRELYTKSNKTLMEESRKDTNKKMSQVCGLEEFTLLKYSYYPK